MGGTGGDQAGSSKEPVKKRKKKTKVEGMPKRPMSSYFFFIGEIRKQVTIDNPEMNLTETTKLLGQKWKALTAEEKLPYEEKATQDKVRYQKAMDEFKAGGGEVPTKSKAGKKSTSKPSEKKKPSPTKKATKKPSSPAHAHVSKETISDSPSSSDAE